MKNIKQFSIILFFLLSFCNLNIAQNNLVPNYSFEDIISCPHPELSSFYSYTLPWYSPTSGTPDIYNICDCFQLNDDTL